MDWDLHILVNGVDPILNVPELVHTDVTILELA